MRYKIAGIVMAVALLIVAGKVALRADEFTEEDLAKATAYKVPENATRMIFSQTSHKRGNPLWKGSCLGIAEDEDGVRYRIAFSYYGGFFKILGHDGYHQTLGSSRRERESLFEKVFRDKFIPARREARSRPVVSPALSD